MANNSYQQPTYINQPLQAPYIFETDGFYQLTQYAAQQNATQKNSNNPTNYRVAPVVASYSTAEVKAAAINGALPADLRQYQAGVTVSTAAAHYPVNRGGVGMVTSSLQSAAQSSATSLNDWHTVGILRHGRTVWVYDPAYKMDSQTRLSMVPGTSNVEKLFKTSTFGTIELIQIQGFGSDQLDCMGRTAQWVDNVIRVPGALDPYPDGTFIPGEVTHGWQQIKRT